MLKLITRSCTIFAIALAAVAMAGQDDWQILTTKEGSLTLSAPPTWIISDLNDPKAREAYERFKKDNPKMAAQMAQEPNTDKYIIALLDTGTGGEIMDAFNLIRQKHGGLTDKQFGLVVDQIAKSVPVKGKVERKSVTLPVGKAMMYWYTMAPKMPDGSVKELDSMGVLFLSREDVYIGTFVGPAGAVKARMPVWEKMVKSFKFGG